MQHPTPPLANTRDRFLFLAERFQALTGLNDQMLAKHNIQLLTEYRSAACELFSRQLSHMSTLLANSTKLDSNTQTILADNLEFDSYVVAEGTKDGYTVHHNLGTALALDDLASRLASHREFLTLEYHDGSKSHLRHQDEAIRFSKAMYPPGKPRFVPRNRYLDYNPIEIAEHRDPGIVYMTGFPAMDPVRSTLADVISTIGFCWIHAHEESHIHFGHFDYARKKNGAKEMRFSVAERAGYGTQLNENSAIEWEADYWATQRILLTFFNRQFLGVVPSYYKCRPLMLFRIVSAAIMAALMIIDKSESGRSTAMPRSHPRAVTRVWNMMSASMSFMDSDFVEPAWRPIIAEAFTEVMGSCPIYWSLSDELTTIARVMTFEDGDAHGRISHRNPLAEHKNAVEICSRFQFMKQGIAFESAAAAGQLKEAWAAARKRIPEVWSDEFQEQWIEKKWQSVRHMLSERGNKWEEFTNEYVEMFKYYRVSLAPEMASYRKAYAGMLASSFPRAIVSMADYENDMDRLFLALQMNAKGGRRTATSRALAFLLRPWRRP